MGILQIFRRLCVVVLFGFMAVGPAYAGKALTDFSLRDINGKEVSLSDFKGKVVLLSFWATWCGPCKVEMAHLSELYNELGEKGFVVLSISSDDAKTSSQVKPYIKRKRYKFPVVLDKQSTVTNNYNPGKTLPYSVLVGKDFTVAKEYAGYQPGDEVKVKEAILAELAK